MRVSLEASVFVVLCGVISGLLIQCLVPKELRDGIPDLRTQNYNLVRTATTAYEITDTKLLPVPWIYADFDLAMDLELGEHMDLDVVLRQVEPRLLGNEVIPFQGRFSVLRLSTNKAGPPWLSRDEALFAPRSGGMEVGAGYIATVWVQARGRLLRANVAGKWLPWFEADDQYGSMTIAARGGTAVLKSLQITNLGQPNVWLWSRWLWCCLGALVGLFSLGLYEIARLGSLQVAAASAAQVGLLALGLNGCWPWSMGVPDPLGFPSSGLMAYQLLLPCLIPVAAGLQSRLGRLAYPITAVLVLLLGLGQSVLRLDPNRNAQVDSAFGPASGSTPSEALAQRVRGPFAVHDITPAEYRVFLLGGQLLYNRAAPMEHLEPLLTGDLRTLLERSKERHVVDVPCLPTIDGYSGQQWQMFTTFYAGYHPDVIVFGVPRDEAAIGANGAPRSSASKLEHVLAAAREYCKEHSIQLVMFTEQDLQADLLAVLKKAETAGIALVVAEAAEAPAAISQRLAAVIAPLLPAKPPR